MPIAQFGQASLGGDVLGGCKIRIGLSGLQTGAAEHINHLPPMN